MNHIGGKGMGHLFLNFVWHLPLNGWDIYALMGGAFMAK